MMLSSLPTRQPNQEARLTRRQNHRAARILSVYQKKSQLNFSVRDFFNRAAMSRARFLFYTGFIINRAAMGKARFVFYTGFIINRAAMGRARFLLCTGFINRAAMGRTRFLLYTGFFFFFMSVTRRKPPLGQIVIGTESRNL